MKTDDVAPSDIIYLNVGGRHMSTSRETLTMVEGSLLATMFNGNWEQSVPRDHNGAIFIDQDPDLFHALLFQLRKLKLFEGKPTDYEGVDVAKSSYSSFIAMCRYYGVHYEVLPFKLIENKGYRAFSPGLSLRRGINVILDGTGHNLYIKTISILVQDNDDADEEKPHYMKYDKTARWKQGDIIELQLRWSSVGCFYQVNSGVGQFLGNVRDGPKLFQKLEIKMQAWKHISNSEHSTPTLYIFSRNIKVMDVEYGLHAGDLPNVE